MKERPIFCRNCPRLPKGVMAEVVKIEFMNRRSLPGVRIPESDRGEIATLVARIDSIAIESSNRLVEKGEELELYVLAGGITGNEIKGKIMSCSEPQSTLLGGKKCRAIEASEVLDTL